MQNLPKKIFFSPNTPICLTYVRPYRAQKWSFLVKISLINKIKSAGSWRFGQNLLNKSLMENFIFCALRGGSRAAATSNMERFVITVNGFQSLSIITKRSILDIAAALDPPLQWYIPNVLHPLHAQWNKLSQIAIPDCLNSLAFEKNISKWYL